MPTSYRIDSHAGVVFIVFDGRITNEEIMHHQRRLSADPDFRSTMNRVIDLRGVTDPAVTAFGVRTVATQRNFASRCAIIAGDTASSDAYVRMFQTLRSQLGEDIKIFSTVEDAHRWLGLE